MPNPEKMDSYEIGYLGRFMNDRVTLDIKLFDNRLTNLIGEEKRQVDGVFGNPLTSVYGNNWTARHQGIETQLQYFDGKNRFHLAHSYIDVTESRNKRINTTPQHTLSALYARKLTPDLGLSVAGFYVDEMKWMGEGVRVDAIHWVDLKIQKDFRLQASKFNLALTVQNLFDNNFANFRNENIEERRVFLTARLAF
jgi:iron complex outermembrane receptor protein